MQQPNSDQLLAAMAILRKFAQTDGPSASETRQASCVYSIFAALGGPGQPAEEYKEVVAAATSGGAVPPAMIKEIEGGAGFEVVGENPLGLVVGRIYFHATEEDDEPEEVTLPPANDLYRMKTAELEEQAAAEGTDISEAKNNQERADAIIAGRNKS